MQVRKVWRSAGPDVRLLWLSVFVRLMSYGLSNQVLTLFLHEVGCSEAQMGWFMSLTLVGDVGLSYVLTWYADRWGRRKVLVVGGVLMAASGAVFSTMRNFYVLLAFAVAGVISPSSDEVGPFKSIEESMMAHMTPHHKRPEVYSMHALVGTLGGALGSVASGWLVDALRGYGLATDLACYRVVFAVYTALALAKVVLMLLLSDTAERNLTEEESAGVLSRLAADDDSAPLLPRNTGRLAPGTVAVLLKLLVVFMLDSLGSGFMTSSWTVYYYSKVFGMSAFALGVLFFACRLIMAVSNIPSAKIARLFGPVKATLLVQIPSGIFSILIPFAEPHLGSSVALLLLFNFTTAMDVTPRQILLTNIIHPNDLTRVMGIVNIGKTSVRCVGPIFTGMLASSGRLWVCYVISGALVILADIILGAFFYGIDGKILSKMNIY
ncbi:ABR173Cp [Eremothecium gossypii ATCC 10895]|uniref:ABR173Cp n=1 Tax=Eremothecium gossypii (strain ATCC 10895 / CBS 109.51 / FGSC 9923 / NRRL Y-1056) TaxID=284811 RepID=Q75D50_EREGS|nr:ABR173Cp [Eremothecium gossypii ATCC 10895]AAS50945.2 ABR173Cp [Eremothecium gossypii ATCC 10895]AEY95235.1 FABR173Cp [Eremothecium gossypii FDAG1]